MKKPTPFGKFLLLDRINVGGMAEVFLAKSFGVAGFERLVAIKKILPTMVEDEEFITMFIDEARIAVQLNHANIVQIYELGKHDENYFIVMEYISGRDLRTILDRTKRQGRLLPPGLAVYMAQKVCEGLDYAHRKRDPRGQDLNIIHRDVSPQNTLISFDGEVKLIDFGIAKAANRAQKTQAGILKGKFGYMSPEQVRGLPIDQRSDIFALGVCLYEMLTGEKLFVSESDFSTLEKVRNAEVPPPREVNADIPVSLEKVMMKALARDVEERYQWASDLQEDLLRFLLLEGHVYGAKHVAAYMQQEFAEAIEAENATLEEYAQIVTPPEVDGEATRGMGVAVRPEEHFGEPPPEMQDGSSDATQLFDPSDHFMPGEDEKSDRPSEEGGAALEPYEFQETPGPHLASEEVLTDQDGIEDEDDAPGLHGGVQQELGAAPVSSEGLEEEENTLTPIKDEVEAGPLGIPGAASRQDAVGLFAAEIPSVVDGRVLEDLGAEDDSELMEEATRITMTGEAASTSPSIRSTRKRPSSEDMATVGRARYTPDDQDEEISGGGFSGFLARTDKRLLMGAGAGLLLAIFSVAGVVAFVGFGAGDEPGDIIIVTSPQSGVEILLDDTLVATESPHVVTSIPPGEYTVAMRRPGTRQRDEQRVEVLPGSRKEVRLVLEEPARVEPEPVVAKADPNDEEDAADPSVAEPPDLPEEALLGEATIRSRPRGALVSLDGEEVGTTPVTLDGLAMDEPHHLVLTLRGHREEEFVLEFDGSNTRDVTLELQRIPPSPPRDQRQVAQQQSQRKSGPRQPVREQKQTTKQQPSGSPGRLVTSTAPVAKVIVNGRDTGRWTPIPPLNPIELPPGTHEITFEADDGRTHTVSVTIRPDEESRLLGISF